MSTLQEHLDDLDPTPAVRTFASALAGRTAVESDRQAHYVSLRPSMEGAVAVYLNRTWISIALSPERAAELDGTVPGASLDKKTAATTYLRAGDDVLAGQHDVLLGIAEEAVAWRANGPKSSVGIGSPKKSEQALQFCPKHQMALLPSGACPDCW
jgi:hypothetical protein